MEQEELLGSWADLGRGRLGIGLESVASAGDSDEFSVVEQPIEDGAGGRHIGGPADHSQLRERLR